MTADGGTDCLFCRIVAREIPAEIVAESPEAVAVRDIAPVAPLHVLIIPKRHIDDATHLAGDDDQLLGGMLALANTVARDHGVDQGGFRLVFNVGDDAGNTVAHLHLHVIGGRALAWPPG